MTVTTKNLENFNFYFVDKNDKKDIKDRKK